MGFGFHSEIQLTHGRAYVLSPRLKFSQEYDDAVFATATSRYPGRLLSLYVIPFCHKLCYFCGCNNIVTRHGAKVDDYLDTLARKIRGRYCSPVSTSAKCIKAGGTPTLLSLSVAQTARLMALLREHFSFTTDIELSIEIDSQDIPLELIDDLQRQGFTYQRRRAGF